MTLIDQVAKEVGLQNEDLPPGMGDRDYWRVFASRAMRPIWYGKMN